MKNYTSFTTSLSTQIRRLAWTVHSTMSSDYYLKKFVSRCLWKWSLSVCACVCVGESVEVGHLKQTNFAALLLLAPCGELPFSFVGGILKSPHKNNQWIKKTRKSTHYVFTVQRKASIWLRNSYKTIQNTCVTHYKIICNNISFSQKLVDSWIYTLADDIIERLLKIWRQGGSSEVEEDCPGGLWGGGVLQIRNHL